MAAEAEQAELEEALVEWVNLFEDGGEGSTACTSLGDLADGVALYDLMAHISAEHFPPAALKRDAAANSFLRKGNLTRLVRGIEAFYRDGLHQSVQCHDVDLQRIAADADAHQLVELIELVLGCAVQCDNKERYIGATMQLDQRLQKHLMVMIQSAMERAQNASFDGGADADADADADAGAIAERGPVGSRDASAARNPSTALGPLWCHRDMYQLIPKFGTASKSTAVRSETQRAPHDNRRRSAAAPRSPPAPSSTCSAAPAPAPRPCSNLSNRSSRSRRARA